MILINFSKKILMKEIRVVLALLKSKRFCCLQLGNLIHEYSVKINTIAGKDEYFDIYITKKSITN